MKMSLHLQARSDQPNDFGQIFAPQAIQEIVKQINEAKSGTLVVREGYQEADEPIGFSTGAGFDKRGIRIDIDFKPGYPKMFMVQQGQMRLVAKYRVDAARATNEQEKKRYPGAKSVISKVEVMAFGLIGKVGI